MIELKHTDIGYEDGPLLVKNATAELRRGEMVALVGENGSGKSTLLRCCAGLIHPAGGAVTFDRRRVADFSPRTLAKRIALVTTANYFYENLHVEEVVSLGRHPYTNWWGSLKDSDRVHVENAIKFVGLEAFSHTPLARLSDGERQRAMIARALAQDTDVLLLDEPMAFLDQPNRASITRVLHNLRNAGKSLVYSTHEVDSIFRHADKCWLLHDRELIEGSPEDLALEGVFDRLYASRGLWFNEQEIRFHLERGSHMPVIVRIEEPRKRMWTLRALERIEGILSEEVVPAGENLVIEEVREGKGWSVKAGENRNEFFSLYEMTAYLTAVR